MTASFDWQRALRKGEVMAVENARADQKLGPEHVMWELFREACRVSRSYSGPPRLGYPSKSSLPEAPSERSAWAQAMDYLRGEIEEMPDQGVAMVRPSADEITRSEHVLFLWHQFALKSKGKRRMLRKAVYCMGCGLSYRVIRSRTGISRASLYRARDEAMRDIWEGLKDIEKMR